MPKVSVTIAAYNNARYLPETLDSIFNQTFKDFEIILVDDASTDNTAEVLKPYQGRIVYSRQAKNQGSAAAWNQAIKQARGEYIALAASDDVWLPEKLQLQIDLFEKNRKLGLVYGRIISIDESGRQLRPAKEDRQYPDGQVFVDLFLRSNFVAASTALIRKEAIDRAGLLDEAFRLCQDYDFYLRIAREFDFGFIDQVLIRYRRHTGSVSTGKRHRAFDYQRQVIDKMWGLKDERITELLYHQRLAQQYAKEGRYYLRHDDKQLARESFAKSLKYRPLWAGTIFKYLLTYL